MLGLVSSNVQPRPPGTVVRFDLYSHHIKVTGFGRPIKDALLEYCRTIAQYGLKKVGRRFIKAMTKVFVGVTRDREEFHFHIHELDDIVKHLGRHGFNQKQIWFVHHPLYTPPTVEYDYIDKRAPRDYQAPIIDYITDPGKTKVVTLDPGRGKTFIALSAIQRLQMRAFFCIKPMYLEKWVGDAEEAFRFKRGELLVIQGTKNLQVLMNLAAEDALDAKIILCSNATFYLYLKQYEIYKEGIKDLGYSLLPHEFFEKMGVGIRVIDEVHQDFHLNYRQDLYSHVPKTLSLSGTLESDDRFINKMYNLMFPPDSRYNDNDRDVYMTVEALVYTMVNAEDRISFMNKALKSYSHIKFEQSIMKRKTILTAYIDMICDIVLKRFVRGRLSGMKIVIYHSTVDMCTITAKELTRRHPTLKVTRYVSEDDYSEMLECDVIVSTLKSLGTAIDVPGLRTVLMTDALGSRQANLQAAGRLRKLKDWPDVSPEFLYLVNTDIQKHRDYHVKKQEIFRGRVLAHRETMTEYKL